MKRLFALAFTLGIAAVFFALIFGIPWAQAALPDFCVSCDVTGDGCFTSADQPALFACFAKPVTGSCAQWDVNKDGFINGLDIGRCFQGCACPTLVLSPLTVDPPSAAVLMGKVQQFQALFDPDGSGPLPSENKTSQAQWSSSITSVATVGKGLATCKTDGITNITATLPGFSAKAKLLCSEFPAQSLLSSPSGPSPRDKATAEQPVILKWSSVEFPGGVAGGYLLEITGENLPSRQVWAETNSYDLTRTTQTLLAGKQHSWRVRACFGFDVPQEDQESQCGPWSNNGTKWTFSPTLAKPILLSPPNTTKQPVFLDPTAKSLKLEWEKVVGADKYLVTLRKISTGFTRVFEVGDPSKPIPDTFFSVNESSFPLDLQNSFAWKVSAQQSNTVGPESDEWQFFTSLANPTLLTPVNGSDVLYPVFPFAWEPVPKVNNYVLEVFDARNARVIQESITQTSIPIALIPKLRAINIIGEQYTWQVTACEAPKKNCGPPSSRFSFTLILDAPEILAPKGNQEVPTQAPPSYKFIWQSSAPVSTAVTFLWEITGPTNISGKYPVLITDAPANVTMQLNRTLNPGPYKWRVRACSYTESSCSAWSKDAAFQVPLPVSAQPPAGPAVPGAPTDSDLKVSPSNEITFSPVKPRESVVWKRALVVQNAGSVPFTADVSVFPKEFVVSPSSVTLTPGEDVGIDIRFNAPDVLLGSYFGEATIRVRGTGISKSVGLLVSVESAAVSGIGVPGPAAPAGKATKILGEGGVADRAVNVAFTALLIAASLFVLLAAFQFATGGGNPEMIAQARDKLIWAAAGIGIALVAKGVAKILQNILLGPSGEPSKVTCPPPPAGGIQNPLQTFCFSGLLDSILNVIFTLSLIVVPFMVIYAGFLFVTGGGNPTQITRARDTLIWTAVGFGVILISKGLPFILKDILGI